MFPPRLFASQILSLSLAGQTKIVRTGSCPGSDSLLYSKPSQAVSPVASYEAAPHYSGGTAPVFHRTSLLSLSTSSDLIILDLTKYYGRLYRSCFRTMLNLNWLNKKWISQLVKPPARRRRDYLRNPFYIAVHNNLEAVYKTECPHNPLPIARRLRTVLELVQYYGDCCIGSSPGSDSLLLQTFPG